MRSTSAARGPVLAELDLEALAREWADGDRRGEGGGGSSEPSERFETAVFDGMLHLIRDDTRWSVPIAVR